jgi:hypothetical protein
MTAESDIHKDERKGITRTLLISQNLFDGSIIVGFTSA